MTNPVSSAPKTIAITGASAGIGEETALLFAERGWRVVLGARRVDRLEKLVQKLKALGARDIVIQNLDVTQDHSVKSFAASAWASCDQRIDVLFNNAGLALGVDHVAKGDISDWQSMLDTNVTGLLRVTREFLPKMLEQSHGHIINMGSIAGHVVYEGGSVYAATKHAVRAITKTIRLEVNGTPVRVSSVDPGMVETDFSLVRFKDDAERAKNIYKGVTPLSGRDIAECVWFAATRPAHVNIEEIVVMPVDQAAPHKLNRKS
jgi:3-hydroxy acid dehydrogenase / malonic semialdehyde reductase